MTILLVVYMNRWATSPIVDFQNMSFCNSSPLLSFKYNFTSQTTQEYVRMYYHRLDYFNVQLTHLMHAKIRANFGDNNIRKSNIGYFSMQCKYFETLHAYNHNNQHHINH